MTTDTAYDRVVAVHDLRDYFRESIGAAIDNQGVDVDPHAAHYVVNLLTLFSRSEDLYEDHGDAYGLRPLALMMADAVDAKTREQRSTCLQRVGDVALFIAGFFAEGLAHHVVDLDYYIGMGGTAYGSLSDEIRGTARGRAMADVYRELAYKFQIVVDVLNEVRENASQSSSLNLLRTYEIWRKTGSRRAAMLLKQNGVETLPGPHRRKNH